MSKQKEKDIPVVILAGGLATRLGERVATVPKALLPVAGAPFLEHQLRLLKKNGFKRVVLCLSHLAEPILEFVGDGSKFGLTVDVSQDAPMRLGTGGAIRNALGLLGERFAIIYGDSYLDIKYADVIKAHSQSGKRGTMTVLLNDGQWGVSNVNFKDGKLLAYSKVNPTEAMQHIDFGFSVFDKEAFEPFSENVGFDLAKVFESLIDTEQMAGYEVAQRFYEIGSEQGLKETEEYLTAQPASPKKRSAKLLA